MAYHRPPWGVVDAPLPAPASSHDATGAGAGLRLSGGRFVAGDKTYQSQHLTEEVQSVRVEVPEFPNERNAMMSSL